LRVVIATAVRPSGLTAMLSNNLPVTSVRVGRIRKVLSAVVA